MASTIKRMELFQTNTHPGGKVFRCKHHCTVAIVATATPETTTAFHFPAPHPTNTTTSTWKITKLTGPGVKLSGMPSANAEHKPMAVMADGESRWSLRSEEHTSELQS